MMVAQLGTHVRQTGARPASRAPPSAQAPSSAAAADLALSEAVPGGISTGPTLRERTTSGTKRRGEPYGQAN